MIDSEPYHRIESIKHSFDFLRPVWQTGVYFYKEHHMHYWQHQFDCLHLLCHYSQNRSEITKLINYRQKSAISKIDIREIRSIKCHWKKGSGLINIL